MVIKQEFTFPSSDGVHTVAAAWWRPEGPPRGVVQLVHGISEPQPAPARRGTPRSSAGSPTGTAGSTW